jgi:hypothetical protein
MGMVGGIIQWTLIEGKSSFPVWVEQRCDEWQIDTAKQMKRVQGENQGPDPDSNAMRHHECGPGEQLTGKNPLPSASGGIWKTT